MVGFLSQNYITPHNNLVNTIVLRIFSHKHKCMYIWNKIYASFYLKDVMNMLLFKKFK